MRKIERIEDIEAWRKARELTRAIYKRTSDSTFKRDFILAEQLRRAVTSVMSNIAEGFERGGDEEFRPFLAMAKGSAGEVKSQMYIALDAGYVTQEEFDELYALTNDSIRLIAGFMRYLKKSLSK